MDIRFSSSTLKVFYSCPFRFYCKITKQKQDKYVDSSYGNAGSVVHHALEYYYNELRDVLPVLALHELAIMFDAEWDLCDIHNKYIDKEIYWECVLSGIALDCNPTELEHEFQVHEENINFVGYADVMNTCDHWIGDWKTSTYKKAKVAMYKDQLKYYAWCYYKEFNIIPDTWVYFNKVPKKFDFAFSKKEMDAVTKEIQDATIDAHKRLETLDFPRKNSSKNCYFCPYKELCATDLLRAEKTEVLEVTFYLKKNKLLVESSMTEEMHFILENDINFEVKNAFFIKKAMRARGIAYDGIKRLYTRKPFGAECFIGYMQHIYEVLKLCARNKGKSIKLTIKDSRNKAMLGHTIQVPDELNIPFEMYDFQKEAVEQLLKNRWGIIEIGTGGGKTVIAAELIRRLGLKTLFIIDNKDLLLQTKKEYETMLGIKCGIVGMGHREWHCPIVLATIQTLAKNAKTFKVELENMPSVIFDETHLLASKSYETLSKYLINSKYRAGFSATPKRDDGNTNVIFAHTGTVVYKKNAQELISQDVLVDPTILFYKYDSPNVITDDWQSEYADGIVDNEKRNNLIKTIAEKYQSEGKQIMILTKMIRHGEWFLENIKGSKLIYGKTKDEVRVDTLEDFKQGKFNILIGNLKIFNKGINIKNLDVLINAAGNAGDVLTVQTIGRVLRKNPGKEEAHYIDFYDNGHFLLKHSKSRIYALEFEKYTIKIVDRFA